MKRKATAGVYIDPQLNDRCAKGVPRAKLRIVARKILSYSLSCARNYPWRSEGRSAFEILIAEILLKRTTAVAVSRLYDHFITRFPSVDALNKATNQQIAESLSNIGLQWQRATALKKLASAIIYNEAGNIPHDLVKLESLPAIGPYTARAIMSFAFDVPSAIVDSNVERIFMRIFHDDMPVRPSYSHFQSLAEKMLPSKYHREFNYGLLDFGAMMCRPRKPLCEKCNLMKWCDYPHRKHSYKSEKLCGSIPN